MSREAKSYSVFIVAVFPDNREEFIVSCEAYDISEAGYQVIVELEAKHNVSGRGGRFVILASGPDTLATAERFDRLRREMGLLKQSSITTA